MKIGGNSGKIAKNLSRKKIQFHEPKHEFHGDKSEIGKFELHQMKKYYYKKEENVKRSDRSEGKFKNKHSK
jgi:hypothetical protein